MARLSALLSALCLWLVLASAALAHAALVGAEPASGTVLDAMVSRVTLTFSEPISPMAFRLLQPDGSAVELAGTAEGSVATVGLPAVDQPGTYFVEWHVVSADGHPVAGTVALSLKAPSTAEGAPVLTDPVVRIGLWLATLLMFAGAFFGVGGAAFAAFLPSTEQDTLRGRLVAVPLIAAAIGVVTSIPLHGAETLGAPASGLLDSAVWAATFATTYGAQVLGFALALMAAIASRLHGAAAPALAVLALLILCGSFILSGHVSTAEPRWLAAAALVAHIAGFSFWIGALPKLFVSLAKPSPRATIVLGIFSRLILYAVAVIIASGATLAVVQLGPPGAAWLSSYGLVLVAKLGILVVLFAVAAWNRFVLTRPALAGDPGAVGRLRALVAVEIVLVLLVLGTVSFWRFTPPPRVLIAVAAAVAVSEHEAAPASVPERIRTHLHASGMMADFEIADMASAPKAVVALYPEAETDIRSVTIRLTPPVADAVPLTLEATSTGDDTWTADIPALSDGRWAVQVEIRVGDFGLAKLKGAVRIGSTKEAGDAD